MPTLFDRSVMGSAADFVARVQQGALQIADEILSEDRNTEFHQARRALARQVLMSPTPVIASMARVVANNDNFGLGGNDAAENTEQGDGALTYILRENWNDFAVAEV